MTSTEQGHTGSGNSKAPALRKGTYILRSGRVTARGRQMDNCFVVLADSNIKVTSAKSFKKHPGLEQERSMLQGDGLLVERDGVLTLLADVSFDSGHKAASFVLASDTAATKWTWEEDGAVTERINEILSAYSERRNAYSLLTEALRSRLEQRLAKKMHSSPIAFTVQSRTKSSSSLEGKLKRKLADNPTHYASVSDVTDLAGIRFIVYEPAKVRGLTELISEVLADEPGFGDFVLDQTSTTTGWDHKPVDVDDDKWYNASHLTVSLTAADDDLPVVCEIQVTDIMSHVINEIGHDLIYKNLPAIQRALTNRHQNAQNVARLLEAFRALFKNLESAQDSVARVSVLASEVAQGKTNG